MPYRTRFWGSPWFSSESAVPSPDAAINAATTFVPKSGRGNQGNGIVEEKMVKIYSALDAAGARALLKWRPMRAWFGSVLKPYGKDLLRQRTVYRNRPFWRTRIVALGSALPRYHLPSLGLGVLTTIVGLIAHADEPSLRIAPVEPAAAQKTFHIARRLSHGPDCRRALGDRSGGDGLRRARPGLGRRDERLPLHRQID